MTVRQLTSSEWTPFVSPYSRPDGDRETFEILEVEVRGKAMSARCRMVQLCPADDGSWHLRASVAAQMSSELKRIHAHVLDGLKTREFSALLTDLRMQFNKAITDPRDIRVELMITDEHALDREGFVTKLYTWAFSFCEGAFVCQSTAQYRRPDREPGAEP